MGIYSRQVKCYLCENIASSKEHVPPQCFFPDTHRKNLITVPSCEVHNNKTQLDDEYLRNIISATKGINPVGKKLFKNKVIRSFEKSPKLFLSTFKNPKNLNFIKYNNSTNSFSFEVDIERVNRTLKKIAYGIYYHNFKKTWERHIYIANLNLKTQNSELDPIAKKIEHNYKLDKTVIFQGANQDVFKYTILLPDNQPNCIVIMKFYDSFETWVLPNPETDASEI